MIVEIRQGDSGQQIFHQLSDDTLKLPTVYTNCVVGTTLCKKLTSNSRRYDSQGTEIDCDR